MAVHYISSSGTDTWVNSTVLTTPCSWATMLSNAAAGDDCRILAGTYSRTTSTDAFTNAGTSALPIQIRGADASGNPISPQRTNGMGALSTTGMPVISYTSGQLAPGAKNYIVITGLSFTSEKAGAALLFAGLYTTIYKCKIVNTANSASAAGVQFSYTDYSYSSVIDCDLSATGASASAAVSTSQNAIARVALCRLTCPAGAGIYDSEGAASAICNVFYSCLVGVDCQSSVTVNDQTIIGNTFYSCTTAVQAKNANLVRYPLAAMNIITDCGRAFNNLYSGTGNLGLLRINNRTRDNTNADVGYDGWPILDGITTDTGGAETDYIDAANGDFRLKHASPARGAALDAGDCGAVPYIPNLPAVADVWTAVTFGQNNEFTGTKRASSITNCTAGNVKKDVVIDDVTGTYDPMAAAVFPAEADVWHGTGAFGPTGAEYTPAMVGSDITNLTADNVLDGVTIDDVTGNIVLPPDTKVLTTQVAYGPGSATVPRYEPPDPAWHWHDQFFGVDDAEEGEMVATDISNLEAQYIISAVIVDAGAHEVVGGFRVPPVDKVEENYEYGPEAVPYIGELEVGQAVSIETVEVAIT